MNGQSCCKLNLSLPLISMNTLIPRQNPHRFGHTGMYGQNDYVSFLESKAHHYHFSLIITMIHVCVRFPSVNLHGISKPQARQ